MLDSRPRRGRQGQQSARLVLAVMFLASGVMIVLGLQALMAGGPASARAPPRNPPSVLTQSEERPVTPRVEAGLAALPPSLRAALLNVPRLEGPIEGERVQSEAVAGGSSADAFKLHVCPPYADRPCEDMFLRALRGPAEARALRRQVHLMDPRLELLTQTRAASVGVSPPVVGLLPAEGAVVTDWADMEPVGARCADATVMRKAARALATLHAVPLSPEDKQNHRSAQLGDEGSVVARVRARLAYAGLAAPERADELLAAVERAMPVVAAARRMNPAYVHGDPSPLNVLEPVVRPGGSDGGDGLWLIDFEYAALGDRFLDVAAYAEMCELDDEQDAAWLDQYMRAAARVSRVAALTVPSELVVARQHVLRFFESVQRATRAVADAELEDSDEGRARAAELFGRAFALLEGEELEASVAVLRAWPAPSATSPLPAH